MRDRALEQKLNEAIAAEDIQKSGTREVTGRKLGRKAKQGQVLEGQGSVSALLGRGNVPLQTAWGRETFFVPSWKDTCRRRPPSHSERWWLAHPRLWGWKGGVDRRGTLRWNRCK